MYLDWLQITVRTTTAGAEIVSELLCAAGADGTQIEDRNDIVMNKRPEGQWDIIDDEIIDKMDEDVLVHAYIAEDEYAKDKISLVDGQLRDVCAMGLDYPLGPMTFTIKTVHEEDWAENWKKYYKPMRVGKSLIIKPTWEGYEAKENDKIINIDPGMAFGTGTHETTNMCMELIEKYMKPNHKVIDVGTGTGILAIAAALTGASDVLAIDLDHVAVRVAKENISLNKLDGIIRAQQGNLLDSVSEVANLVVANIIADVIVFLAAPVKNHIVDGGYFICSGIIRDREADVQWAVDAAGYEVIEIMRKGEWVAMVLKK